MLPTAHGNEFPASWLMSAECPAVTQKWFISAARCKGHVEGVNARHGDKSSWSELLSWASPPGLPPKSLHLSADALHCADTDTQARGNLAQSWPVLPC